MNAKSAKWVKPVALLVGVIALFLLWNALPIAEWMRDLLAWVEGLGPVGPLALGVIYVLACILFIPGWLLTLGAGALFGVVVGAITVSISSTLGASAAFLIGRYFARDTIAKRIEGNARFRAVDEAVAREGWKIVLLVRLSPVFPFNLINYAFGLTKVTLKNYFFASWIGMFPGTLMYVYVGSVVGDLATLGMGEREKGWLEWALYLVGLLVTVIVTVYVTKIARKALRETIHEEPSAASG
jgi:uncharacterized membrane protein YdjX (TVP38/TMEM64 family)